MEFIYECEDAFPVSFCNRVIDKFEKSDLKFVGRTDEAAINPIKKSTDLRIYDEPEWVEEEKYFLDTLRKAKKKYETFLLKMDVDDEVKKQMSTILIESHVSPPQIQRTEPGQYYHWHHDESLIEPKWQTFTYLIYLNDVEKDSGGTTEFSCGKTIQPKAGKIVFFPCKWTYFHRGKTLEKGIKYIATAGLLCRPMREIISSRRQLEEQKLPFIISRD
jgi:Rps23 Pro-64 3,4-dihydroxylase Tpa1-like proline 4-hydroxylase